MNKKFNKIYQQERDKLSCLPDLDDDFKALDNAIIKYNSKYETNLTFLDVYRNNK